MTAPRIVTVSRGNREGKSRLLYDQIQPTKPVIRVSRPIVTTTAVSGSPPSNLRMRNRSTIAPKRNENSTEARIARISGTPTCVSV